jgi:DNA-binding Lrp family transcriptional regulator
VVKALVLARVGSSDTLNLMKTIREELTRVKGVKEIYGLLGRYDFALIVETKTTEEMGSLVTDSIRGIKGVVYTETLVIGF